MQTHTVYPPIGTRIYAIVYRDTHWEIWTSANTRIGDSACWYGVFTEVYPDGTAYTINRRPDMTEERMRVR
jgi:hypothetical protein